MIDLQYLCYNHLRQKMAEVRVMHVWQACVADTAAIPEGNFIVTINNCY